MSRDMPRFSSTGFARRPARLQQRKVLHVARADLDDVRVLLDQVHVSVSTASVTMARPNCSRISARIFSPSSPRPWNAYGEVRGLYAPPRKNLRPALATRSAAAKACSRDSDSARAGDDGDFVAADRRFASRESARLCLRPYLAADQLVRLADANDFLHARHLFEGAGIDFACCR